jgi:hypothetical protein
MALCVNVDSNPLSNPIRIYSLVLHSLTDKVEYITEKHTLCNHPSISVLNIVPNELTIPSAGISMQDGGTCIYI